jgi:MFS family permease
MTEYLSGITGRAITHLALVFTVANTVGPVTMISGGFFNDRFGPRFVVLIGGILFSGGFIISGFATSVGMLVASYGLGVGLGMGMVYGCTVSNTVKFFPDRSGVAGGLAVASYGISSAIMPPIANSLIKSFGITTTFKVIGIVMFFVIGIASFFITRCPPDFVPEGLQPPVSSKKKCEDMDWRGMLKSPVFYVMLLLLCCGAFSGLMIISQASPLARHMIGMSATPAAAAVSVLAILNTCGRIVAGFIFDKIGIVKTLLSIFILSIIGLIVLYFSGAGTIVRFYIGLACIGMVFGSIMGIFPGFTALRFGFSHNSVNYGIMFIGFAISGYFGPTVMNIVFAQKGSYKPAFLIAICLIIAGMLLAIIYAILTKPSITKNNRKIEIILEENRKCSG